jgi:hypothetical protein
MDVNVNEVFQGLAEDIQVYQNQHLKGEGVEEGDSPKKECLLM